MLPTVVLRGNFRHGALCDGSRAVQQLTRFTQQGFNTLQGGDLFVRDSVQILLLLAQLKLKRFLTLFQFHQALR